jgi:cardiolipin synthase (CMP-forming)
VAGGGGSGGGGDGEEEEKARRKRETVFGTIPNVLTMARIASTPLLCWWIVEGAYGEAAALFVASAALDVADGFIARHVPNQKSYLGSFLDPFADKVLIGGTFLSLTYVGAIHWALALLVVGRDVALVGYLFRERARRHWGKDTFFQPKVDGVEVRPSALSKANTGLQVGLVALALAHLALPALQTPEIDLALSGMHWLIAATTFASGADYLLNPGVRNHK